MFNCSRLNAARRTYTVLVLDTIDGDQINTIQHRPNSTAFDLVKFEKVYRVEFDSVASVHVSGFLQNFSNVQSEAILSLYNLGSLTVFEVTRE